MIFNSLQFLIFFPIVTLIGFLFPNNKRYIWFFITSYYFYLSWNLKFVIPLLFVTLITYLSARIIVYLRNNENKKNNNKFIKLCLGLSFFLVLGMLFFFKYYNFTVVCLNLLLSKMKIDVEVPEHNYLLPVGISFFTFQALSYVMDVYRKEVNVEKNFIKYASFVAFFPNISAGPIERAKSLLKQIGAPKAFDYDRMREGFLQMLWGYFLKLVVADRISIFVDAAYSDIDTFGGCFLIVATILFGFQIYCDFAGYSKIAIGAAEIMGVDIITNFNAPYMSSTCAEFWRRWHISLSTWFRDYLYIPLGGNRKGKIQKFLNLMIVFICSGLWHGANWTFIFWGGINGFYQVIGEILKPLRCNVTKLLRLNCKSIGHNMLRVLVTFIFIDFAWLFFKASSITHAFTIIKSIITVHNLWIFFDESIFTCGLNRKNFCLLILSLIGVIVVDMFQYKGVQLRKVILEQDWWFRYLVIIFSVLFILVFGIWGSGYDIAGFLYFEF